MVNHHYIISRGNLSLDRVQQDLEGILSVRFRKIVESKRESDCLLVYCLGSDHQLNFYLETKRKIDIRPALPDWMDWIEAVIKHELAIKYKGYIGCSLSPEKVVPEAGKYPTYLSWMQSEWDRIQSFVKASARSSLGEKELSIKRRLAMLPSALQPLVK